MSGYVLTFPEIDPTQIQAVGGKGAQLGLIARLADVRVPPGFCVTTAAFRRVTQDLPSLDATLEQVARLGLSQPEALARLSAEARRIIESVPFPNDVATAIRGALVDCGERTAYAVRSSATAEDLPAASFAGQHDTFLNVVGAEAILQQVSRCWASLFTERALSYRLRNGIEQRQVQMGVVVQRMVFPRASGVLFTADPLTGQRQVCAVEACLGLGEALVSGLVTPDVYKVRAGAILQKTIGKKQHALRAAAAGGTEAQPLDPAQRLEPALTDAELLELVELGRRIEAHCGHPQDIEWCLTDDGFSIVQSRPITTLFPIPLRADHEPHVYLSVGHQQMMTDAMKPLGVSFRQLTAATAMYDAGGRVFVDVSQALASPTSRAGLLAMVGKSDPLLGDALETLLARGDFIPTRAEEPKPAAASAATASAIAPLETDPAIVRALVAQSEASVAALKRDIQGKQGVELFDFMRADFAELKRILMDRKSFQAIMAGMEATWWLNDQLATWLGEQSAADTLTLSAPNNITSEMGLALLDVADVIRPHPKLVAFLEQVRDDDFLDRLAELEGGHAARAAISAWLDRFGMRGVGEIDITRPRWSEQPSLLVRLILDNVKHFEAGAAKERFERGRQQAQKKEQELLARLRALPDGESKAVETKRQIDRLRTFIGYREYPKYGMICRYLVYKRALLAEAARLVEARVLSAPEDIYFFTFDELREVVRTERVDDALIAERKDTFRAYQALTPPRVLTSEGECLNGSYRREQLPAGALVGLAVSAGAVEGRARIVLDMAQAALEPGDILVTVFTDPSWTPLFVAISGLVTEVGGLMTHGAVIAREYGVPAIVGVEQATRLIRDGQRIRIDGSTGVIEILA